MLKLLSKTALCHIVCNSPVYFCYAYRSGQHCGLFSNGMK